MSEKSVCRKCKYFNGFDGVGELWTGCHFGDFKGIKTSCNNFEMKITKADLLRRVSELEKENEKLKKARDESDKFIVKKGLEIEFLNWCVENE